MKVVSDATALIALMRLGQLNLLKGLCSEVCIPAAVYEECSLEEKEGYSGFSEAVKEGWIKIYTPTETFPLKDVLDEGEAECIALTAELQARFLIMDEKKGRREAKRRGLNVIGLLGILSMAKHQGIIKETHPLLKNLLANGFYLSQGLVKRYLREVGEGDD